MSEAIRFLAQYDYWLLLGAILGRQACLPIPAIHDRYLSRTNGVVLAPPPDGGLLVHVR
jgi:hypothetical protein